MKKIALVMGFVLLCGTAAFATPSTQIWIPSTDIQPFKKVHFGFDQYIKTRKIDGATREANVINNGITVGVLPFEKVQMEVGIDQRAYGVEPADSAPYYFNAKIGVPEDAMFSNSPAVAVGGYDYGTKKFDANTGFGTDYNITYGLLAKTLGKAGRFSVGYYQGSDKLLLDKTGQKDSTGVLASWDRTLSEISDKLWVAVDYMGGENGYGALSYGAAWKFAPNVGVILGMDKYNNDNFKSTYTVQVDIDLDL
ncbi:MAG: hypothetical protein OEW15_05480 [Nitrospirota bacterium]|nr:hypothetical protein [Nitrospirota bacterium]